MWYKFFSVTLVLSFKLFFVLVRSLLLKLIHIVVNIDIKLFFMSICYGENRSLVCESFICAAKYFLFLGFWFQKRGSHTFTNAILTHLFV